MPGKCSGQLCTTGLQVTAVLSPAYHFLTAERVFSWLGPGLSPQSSWKPSLSASSLGKSNHSLSSATKLRHWVSAPPMSPMGLLPSKSTGMLQLQPAVLQHSLCGCIMGQPGQAGHKQQCGAAGHHGAGHRAHAGYASPAGNEPPKGTSGW